MGHGTPLDVQTGYGASGSFMLDVGISSTVEIARSWGLVPSFEKRRNMESSALEPERTSHPLGSKGGNTGKFKRSLKMPCGPPGCCDRFFRRRIAQGMGCLSVPSPFAEIRAE
jgi:hypothetical protein